MSESKKKLVRNIIIAIVVIVVLAAAVTAVVLLRKDAFGLNYFERNAVVASVGAETVTYGEFVGAFMNYYSNIDTYNMYAMYYGSGTYYDTTTEEGMTNLKQDMLDELVYQRVYIALSEELGLTLSDEELAECVKAGKDAYTSLEEECAKQAESAGAADESGCSAKDDAPTNAELPAVGHRAADLRIFHPAAPVAGAGFALQYAQRAVLRAYVRYRDG